jgi:hypothetical protein
MDSFGKNGDGIIEMNKAQLTGILQMTKESVEEVYGPIQTGNDESGKSLVNTYIVNIVLCVLQNLIPKEANVNVMEE